MPSYAVSIPKLHRELVIVEGEDDADAVAKARIGRGIVVGAAEFVRDLNAEDHEWICVEVA